MKKLCALIILLLAVWEPRASRRISDKKPPDRDMIGTSLSRKLCNPDR